MAQKIKALVFYLPVKSQETTTEKATTAAAESTTGELSLNFIPLNGQFFYLG